MKKIIFVGLLFASVNANAFLNFNGYNSGYNNNNWPIWTPMYWAEKASDNNNFGNNNNQNYGYPYNNRTYKNNHYNNNASQFNTIQTPTPNQALQDELQSASKPVYITPAAMSFSNSNTTQLNKLPTSNPINLYGGRF
jgi:hypothetical protein